MLAFAALGWGAGFAWFTLAPPGPAPDAERTDAIVVLTGDAGRTLRGVRLLARGAAPRLFISGVGARTGRGSIARATGMPRALFACCVELGHAANDTRGNAEETARWVAARRVRSVRLVTSDYHMRRAALELAAELGPGVAIVRDAVPGRLGLRAQAEEYSKWLVRAAARAAGNA